MPFSLPLASPFRCGCEEQLSTRVYTVTLAVDVGAFNHAEVNLIEPLIGAAVTRHVPGRLIYDRAADSDPLRRRLCSQNTASRSSLEETGSAILSGAIS